MPRATEMGVICATNSNPSPYAQATTEACARPCRRGESDQSAVSMLPPGQPVSGPAATQVRWWVIFTRRLGESWLADCSSVHATVQTKLFKEQQ
jgi:hypothetical protein